MFHVFRKVVVHRQLFARFDRAEAHIQDVPLHDAADQIRRATVIDDFGSAPAGRAIDGPISVHSEKVRTHAPVALLRLTPVQAFSGIFDDFPVGGNGYFGIYAISMDLRSSNRQLEARVSWIQIRSFYRCGSHIDKLLEYLD